METKKQFSKVTIRKNGAPEVLEIKTESLIPKKSNGLLIEVWAFGVGWADIMAQRGGYAIAPKKPFTPGYDFVGRVIENYNSKNFRVNDMVAALLPTMGTYSELLEVDEKYLVKIPENTPIDKAAASILNYTTAYCILEQKAKVKKHSTVYIQGASGGVGLALAQIGKLKALSMYGTTSSSKAELISEYNVTPIDYQSENPSTYILGRHPKGIDAAFDARGGKSLTECIKMVKRGGKVVSYGFSGDNHGGNKEMFNGLGIIVKNLFIPNGKKIKLCGTPSEVKNNNDWYKKTLVKILNQINTKEINPILSKVIPFNDVVEAHKLMERGRLEGKVIVKTKYYK